MNLKGLLNYFVYLGLKNSAFNLNFNSKNGIAEKEAILNCQNFAWSSFNCLLGMLSLLYSKTIAHYPDNYAAIYRLLLNKTILD